MTLEVYLLTSVVPERVQFRVEYVLLTSAIQAGSVIAPVKFITPVVDSDRHDFA